MHVQEKCSREDCDQRSCPLRHQRPCKFFQIYQKCKFGDYCAFLHNESEYVKELNLLKTKIENLENVFEKKLSEMEIQIQTERDAFNLLFDKVSEIENKLTNDTAGAISAEPEVPNEKEFRCDQCEYSSSTRKGLKTHSTKKHKVPKPVVKNSDENSDDSSADLICPSCSYEPVYTGFIPPWEKQKLMLTNHMREKHPDWKPS